MLLTTEGMEAQARQIAELLKVLANENRLMLLCALLDGPQTVSALATRVPGISQPALSQHLSMLRMSGIVDYTRQGQHSCYFVRDQRVAEVISVLKRHYCTDAG